VDIEQGERQAPSAHKTPVVIIVSKEFVTVNIAAEASTDFETVDQSSTRSSPARMFAM